MYAVKKFNIRDLNIRSLFDFKKWALSIKEGIEGFLDLMNEQYMDVMPSSERNQIRARLNDGLNEIEITNTEVRKSVKLNIAGIEVSGSPASLTLIAGVTYLILATQQFVKARFNLALGYRILREVSINAYNGQQTLERVQGKISKLNKKNLPNDQEFEVFEDEGYHDRLLDAVGLIFNAINKLESSKSYLYSGIEGKRLNRHVFKHLGRMKSSTNSIYERIKNGRMPEDKEVELLIVNLTTFLEGINDLSADINRATNSDLNSRVGSLVYSLLGNHIKFGG